MCIHRTEIDAVEKEEFRSTVRRDGWSVVAGSNTTLTDFERFVRQFGACTDTRAVHYPSDGSGLGFHAEDAYNPYRPDALWFVCLSENGDDGAPTYLVDGEVMLAELSPRWQRFCRDNTVRYGRRWAPYVWQEALGTSDPTELDAYLADLPNVSHRLLDNGELGVSVEVPILTTLDDGREFFSNTIPQAATQPNFYGMSLPDGSPVPHEFISQVNQVAARHEFPLRWEMGHVAAIDNRRMMHRRGGYAGTGRDLRAAHGEDFFGSVLPRADSALARWTKSLLQGEEGFPVTTGPASLTVPALGERQRL